jgi:hypothetical protein
MGKKSERREQRTVVAKAREEAERIEQEKREAQALAETRAWWAGLTEEEREGYRRQRREKRAVTRTFLRMASLVALGRDALP